MRKLYMFGNDEPESIDLNEDKLSDTVKDPRGIMLFQYIYASTMTVEATLELVRAGLVTMSYEDGSPADLGELARQVENNHMELSKLVEEFDLEFSDEIGI
jgi:hypothetical protein